MKCCHPKCGTTICIAFLHPSLNEESYNRLCQKYLDMLVSSHTSGCPYRSFTSRWSKVMHQSRSKAAHCDKLKRAEIITVENNSEYLMNRVSVLSDSKTHFYFPPYFLSLTDDCLRFDNCTGDGTITRDRVKEGAL